MAITCVQTEMAGSPDTAAILEALNSQRADARERQAAMERQIREEARRLRGGITGSQAQCMLYSCNAQYMPVLGKTEWFVGGAPSLVLG